MVLTASDGNFVVGIETIDKRTRSLEKQNSLTWHLKVRSPCKTLLCYNRVSTSYNVYLKLKDHLTSPAERKMN